MTGINLSTFTASTSSTSTERIEHKTVGTCSKSVQMTFFSLLLY